MTTSLFKPLFEAAGVRVFYPDYGWIAGVGTNLFNPHIVGTIATYIEPDDWLMCHSNGCAIAYEIMQRGVEMAGATFINAALEQRISRPAGVGCIRVLYNSGDDATIAAQIAARLGIVDPDWGDMGHAGYSGSDPLIENVCCDTPPAPLPELYGHSDFFGAKFAQWGPAEVAVVMARATTSTP